MLKGHSFVVRGKFDSKILLTDPVSHLNKFQIENELVRRKHSTRAFQVPLLSSTLTQLELSC